MKNFTKMKSWLMLLVFGLMFTAPSAFAVGNIIDPPADLSVTIEETDLGLFPTSPEAYDFWLEPSVLIIENNGNVDAQINAVDFEETNEHFTVIGFMRDGEVVTLPQVLVAGVDADETLQVLIEGVFPQETGMAGTLPPYSTDLIVSLEGVNPILEFEAFSITGTPYLEGVGDLWEKPIVQAVVLGDGPTLFAAPTGGTRTRLNYSYADLEEEAEPSFTYTKDRVWKITAEQDMSFSMGYDFDNKSSESPYQVAAYASDFGGEGGPMADNALAAGLFLELQMFEGDVYYIVATYDQDEMGEPDTWLAYGAEAMTAPAAVAKFGPIDEAVDVISDNYLKWQYGDTQAEQYRVLLGTEAPLDDADVVVDWMDAKRFDEGYVGFGKDMVIADDSVKLADLVDFDLLPNQIYFWRVDVKNTVGETTDPNSHLFTTTLSIPQTLIANGGTDPVEMFTDESVVLEWNDPNGETGTRAFQGYNVYMDGDMLNTDGIVTAQTYTVSGLEYNMDGYDADVVTGYEFTVTAVYDEGESDVSGSVFVFVSAYGDFYGVVTDAVTGDPIAGADVAALGTDEFGAAAGLATVTDVAGKYLLEDLEFGAFTIDVTANGYLAGTATSTLDMVNDSVMIDFVLNEDPYAVDTVYAVIAGPDVEVTWTMDSKELVNFDVVRKQVLGNPTIVATTDIGTTTGNILLDEAWIADTLSGVYAWGVAVNYDLNSSGVVYSATIDKTMETEVDVIVTTEFGDDPVATVTFTNTSEPLLDLEYEMTLTATGTYTFEDFRKGTYDYSVELVGYGTQTDTAMLIWGHNTLEIDLLGGTPPAQNLVADNDSLYFGDDVVLTWEPSTSSQFQGYMLYKNDVALWLTPQAELTYTDLSPAYNMTTGHEYYVTTWYEGVESAASNVIYVKVTGEGAVAGVVTNGWDDSKLKDVSIKLDGFDEYGFAQQYSFTTDDLGAYASAGTLVVDGVLAGEYEVEVYKEGFTLVEDPYTVEYATETAADYTLYPELGVVAVELDADQVKLTWEFDITEKSVVDYDIYMTTWNGNEEEDWIYLGNSLGQIFIDDSWGDVDYGAYKWVVVTNFDNPGTTVAFSNVLLKDMEASAGITVALNTLESAEGTEVSLEYVDGFMDTTYMATLDATGVNSFDPIYKGFYKVKVKLFGYETITSMVEVKSDTTFAYELIELLFPVTNLYVTPNGYATWGVVQPGGAPEYVADFNDGVPADVTIKTAYGAGWYHYQQNDTTGYMTAADETNGHDSEFSLPIVEVEDDTYVIQFVWAMNWLSYASSNEFDVEVSTNNGLTWASVWSMHDAGIYQSAWLQETIALSGLGITDGTVLVRFHSVDDYASRLWVDNIYVGAAIEEEEGTMIAATVGYQPTEKGSFSMESFNASTNWLVKFDHTAPSSSKSLELFKVSLDDTFMADVMETEFDYEVATTLVGGQEYTARVTAEYTSGVSEEMTYVFVYLPCDSFNAVEDLVATRVLGTMDVNLTWTNDNALADLDVFEGTNIYKDGMFVAFVEAGVVTYTDGDLTSGIYNYCLTQVYESEAESCETCATVEMTAGGFVEGFVYEFGTTTTPIEGASVAIVGTTENYVFETDALGYYSGEVVNDTVDYTVSADTYESVMEADVIIAFGATVTKDFYLKEFPSAVGYVIAEELSDDAVKVTWGGESTPPNSAWLTYDDGVNWNALGNGTALTMSWAAKYDAAQLTSFIDCAVTEVEGFLNFGTDQVATTITVRVWAGAEAATLLYEEDVTSQVVWGEYTTFTLAEAVPFDNAEELWIGFYGEAAGSSHPAGLTNTAPASLNGDLYNSGAGWLHASDLAAGVNFNISGFVTNQFGAKMALNPTTDKTEYKALPLSSFEIITAATPTYKEEAIEVMYANSSIKGFVGYNIYRGLADGDAATDLEFLGSTLDESFNDNTWDDAEWGMHRWAVEAVYTNNASALVYSNILDKDMLTQVNMEVSTTSGDSPSGASVVFADVNSELEIITSIPGSGLKTIEGFRRGTYDITVTKLGFVPLTLDAEIIHDTTTFVWVLVEDLAIPSNLYVTPTGLATWTGLGGAAFEPYAENFDEASSFENWEVIVGGSTSDSWTWTAGGGDDLNGTAYAFVNSDGAGIGSTMDEMLISPVINASAATQLFVNFDQYYRNLNAAELADVEVYNGSEWILVLHQAATAGEWGAANSVSIDVTEHANAEFRVRFHYVAPGWDWYWAVDNFVVTNEAAAKSNKEVVEYLVYHDDANTNNVAETTYQYGLLETEVLVSGVTYLAEVAAAYTTGISERAAYTWTYLPCDSFPAYTYFDAINVDGTTDVLVNWSAFEGTVVPGDVFEDNFESYEDFDIVYSPWTSYDLDGAVPYGFTGITFPNADVPRAGIIFNPLTCVPALEGPLAMSGDKYLAIFNCMTPVVDNDDWNITPQLTIGDNYEVSFYATGGNALYSAEKFQVFVSTGEAVVADMVSVSDVITTPANTVEWVKYTYDLSAYAGDDVYVGIHVTSHDQFFLCVDDFYVGPATTAKTVNTVSATSGAQASGIASKGVAQGESIAAATLSQSDLNTRFATLVRNAKAEGDIFGTNVYRDAELIAFVPAVDTFYMDMDLEFGIYEYCVATVYTMDAGLHTWESCAGANCVDVTVAEECLAPTDLTAEDLLGDGYTATLNWNGAGGGSFDPQWVALDDGINVDAIGLTAGGSIAVAAKWDAADLVGFEGGVVSKIKFFAGDAPGASITIKVWQGDNGDEIYSEDITGVTYGDWNEFDLATPVAIDVTQAIWVGYESIHNAGDFIAGVGDAVANPNSDLVMLDGGAWDNLQNYLPYSWNIGAYIESAKGAIVELPVLSEGSIAQTNSYSGAFETTGTIQENIDPTREVSDFLGYNIYRDGTMIEENYADNTYTDDIGSYYEVCYTVSAVYEYCGESDLSEQACVSPGVGVSPIENVISVYPNPAKDYVTVESSNDILTIKVTNYMGQVVNYIQNVEVTSHTIATSSYSSGVYFVEVKTATGVEKVRIVISE